MYQKCLIRSTAPERVKSCNHRLTAVLRQLNSNYCFQCEIHFHFIHKLSVTCGDLQRFCESPCNRVRFSPLPCPDKFDGFAVNLVYYQQYLFMFDYHSDSIEINIPKPWPYCARWIFNLKHLNWYMNNAFYEYLWNIKWNSQFSHKFRNITCV